VTQSSTETKPVFLPYGNGCDIIVDGVRQTFCDNCFECPLPDCKANVGGDSKYQFRLLRDDNGNGHKFEMEQIL
jgi:hypothetical protein